MNYKEKFKKQFTGWTKKEIISSSLLIGLVITMIATLPITTQNTIDFHLKQIADAKTCSDIFNDDTTNLVEGSFLETMDTTNQVKNALDAKAHQLCKPLYDLEQKYGKDFQMSDISKMSCSDIAILIHTVSTKQEVINEYVSRCTIK